MQKPSTPASRGEEIVRVHELTTRLVFPTPSSDDQFPPQPPKPSSADTKAINDLAYRLTNSRGTFSSRKRSVFRTWPRASSGEFLRVTPPGKAPPGSEILLWGSTLLDLFYVSRIPEAFGASTISSGSKLSAWAHEIGELDAATAELAWAERESEPVVIEPYDVANLVQADESQIIAGWKGKSMPKEGGWQWWAGREQVSEESVFHFTKYPSPWPLIPFTYTPPTMNRRLPLRLLPKRLIVHDPFRLVRFQDLSSCRTDEASKKGTPASEPHEHDADDLKWINDDITHVYDLSLSPSGLRTLAAEQAEIEAQLASNKPAEGFVIIQPHSKPGPIDAPVYVTYPHKPPLLPQGVDEAHLYLAAPAVGEPKCLRAEWEVPRELIVDEQVMCRDCVVQATREEIAKHAEEIRKSSKGQGRLVAVPPGNTKHALNVDIDVVDASTFEEESRSTKRNRTILFDESNTSPRWEYSGPVHPVHVDVPWQNPCSLPNATLCEHLTPHPTKHPLTTKLRVFVKRESAPNRWPYGHGSTSDMPIFDLENLSAQEAEAYAYQRFPPYFSQHWSGMAIVPPPYDPVPVGAIVPQFYGCYKPSGRTVDGKIYVEKTPGQLSNLIILEDCGKPIPKKMGSEDRYCQRVKVDTNTWVTSSFSRFIRKECSSLIRRMHMAGWTHGKAKSMRSYLIQPGPLDLHPFLRTFGSKAESSFRVVDFPLARWISGMKNEEREEAKRVDEVRRRNWKASFHPPLQLYMENRFQGGPDGESAHGYEGSWVEDRPDEVMYYPDDHLTWGRGTGDRTVTMEEEGRAVDRLFKVDFWGEERLRDGEGEGEGEEDNGEENGESEDEQSVPETDE